MGENVALDGQTTITLPKVHHLTDKGTADNPLHMGLIGLGSMGRHHTRVIHVIEGMELMAVADPGGDRFGVAGELSVLPDVHALVDTRLNAAMVAIPTVHREGVALALAEASVYTMVEKSTTRDATADRRMATAFAERGLVGVVGYVERCNSALRALRERFDIGELGEVYQVLTRRQGPFLACTSDAGIVKGLATHDIGLTAWVADTHYTSVAAQVTHRSGHQSKGVMMAISLLEGGIVVSHRVNWFTPLKERVTIITDEKGAFVASTLTRDLTFHTSGTVASTWDQVAAFRGVNEGDVVCYAILKCESLVLEQENFRDAVHGVAQCHVTVAEGVTTLDVVEAVLTSAGGSRTVTL